MWSGWLAGSCRSVGRHRLAFLSPYQLLTFPACLMYSLPRGIRANLESGRSGIRQRKAQLHPAHSRLIGPTVKIRRLRLISLPACAGIRVHSNQLPNNPNGLPIRLSLAAITVASGALVASGRIIWGCVIPGRTAITPVYPDGVVSTIPSKGLGRCYASCITAKRKQKKRNGNPRSLHAPSPHAIEMQ